METRVSRNRTDATSIIRQTTTKLIEEHINKDLRENATSIELANNHHAISNTQTEEPSMMEASPLTLNLKENQTDQLRRPASPASSARNSNAHLTILMAEALTVRFAHLAGIASSKISLAPKFIKLSNANSEQVVIEKGMDAIYFTQMVIKHL